MSKDNTFTAGAIEVVYWQENGEALKLYLTIRDIAGLCDHLESVLGEVGRMAGGF